MNLFILSNHLESNVKYHVDRHVVKMPIEATQLCCTVARERCGLDIGYKSTYVNHPVTAWVGATLGNFVWTTLYAKALFAEYTYRYNRVHASQLVLELLLENMHPIEKMLPAGGMTEHYKAVSPELKELEPVLAYRAYYLKHKRRLFNWTKREVPSWIVDPQYEIRDYL